MRPERALVQRKGRHFHSFGGPRLVVSQIRDELVESLHDDDAKLMERLNDFPMGRGIRNYFDGWAFHFHLVFPAVLGGVHQNDGADVSICGLLQKSPHGIREFRHMFDEDGLVKGSVGVTERNGEPDSEQAPVLVFIDEGVENSQRTVPGLSWAVVRLHSLNGFDCPFRDSCERPSESLSAFARVLHVDWKGGPSAPVFWLGESPYDVIESRPQVGHYVASDGRKQRWRRLMPGQDPVAVAYGKASLSWRINQDSIGMTIGIRGDERVQVGEMGFCSPDLFSGARLR
jgi:hypothetical protein